MALYAIGDLHLSFSSNKPMDIFGGNWINHTEKLEKAWRQMITEDDTVFLLGDLSWALKLEQAKVDFKWINSLPGHKIIIKGNHDLWWGTCTQMNSLYDRLVFMQNDFLVYNGYAICGTRGWVCPKDKNFTEHDQKIYAREVGRLKLSLELAAKAEHKKIIVGLHFPPTNDRHEDSGFTELCEAYGVEMVIYGHLHGEEQYKNGYQGLRNGVEYKFAACDYLDCVPIKIIE